MQNSIMNKYEGGSIGARFVRVFKTKKDKELWDRSIFSAPITKQLGESGFRVLDVGYVIRKKSYLI